MIATSVTGFQVNPPGLEDALNEAGKLEVVPNMAIPSDRALNSPNAGQSPGCDRRLNVRNSS